MSSLSIVDLSELTVVSDLQERESWVDVECQDEVDNIRLMLSRELGEPEPELYGSDDYDDQEEAQNQSSEDWEGILNQVIELQERMSRGMKMIQQCRSVLSLARAGKRIPYNDFISWREREKTLWNHWNNLKSECMELIGENTWIWRRYFLLSESLLDRTTYTNDETDCPEWLIDFDELVNLNLNSEDCVEE